MAEGKERDMSTEREISIRQVVTYQNHNRRNNGAVTLNLNSEYSELVHTIELQQLLSQDIHIVAKVAGERPYKLGLFRLKKSTILDDGESKLQFEGLSDYVEVDNLNHLPLKSDDVPQFAVTYTATVELEDDEEEESENWEDDDWGDE